MDWNRGPQCIMNVGVNSVCSNLGYVEDGIYIASDDCEDNLIELLKNLQEENSTLRTYRRQLCFSRVVEMDIIPLIKYIKDQPEIFSAAVRFLATLIQPVECLTLGMPSDVTLPWIPDVKKMLLSTKKLCTDKDLISAIASEITIVIDDHDGQTMSEEDCDFINKCLLLFRNFLYIQDVESQVNQETIVLYLLECRIGEMINKLVAIPQREYWSASIVQLVSLMYTQHTLEILKPCLSQDDMSDNVSCCESDDRDYEFLRQNNFCHDNESHESSSTSLTGLFGKTLHVEEAPSVSEADINQSNDLDKGERKGIEEDMLVCDEQDNRRLETFRHLLLEFTHAFIDKGFGYLVHDLKNVLMSDMKDCLDDTYFLWAMAFFLKIARRENASFRVIRLVLTTELFGFLLYEGVFLVEQLLIAKKKKNDPTNVTRRLHLTVSALHELLKTLLKCSSDNSLDGEDIEYLIGLQKDLANITDLKMIFVLLIRHYQSEDTNVCLLEELITANHTFLTLMDSWDRNGWILNNFNMIDHVKMFGTRNIMQFYGVLLANFEHNTTHLNLCIFTMMHHIAGDCEKMDVLLQLPIIQALMEVDGSKNHVTKEMMDLTEYILSIFMNIAKTDPLLTASHLYGLIDKEISWSGSSSTGSGGSADSTEIDDMLFALYTELQKEDCMVEKIRERFADIGINITLEEVWSRLHGNGLITDSEYKASEILIGMEEEECHRTVANEERDVIEVCVNALKDNNQEDNLKLIQTALCETAYVKLGKQYDRNIYEEPVTMFHVLRGSSVPLVLYTDDQESLLQDQHFKTLLHYMGFHTPQDVDMIFPRIPSFWTSEQLIKQAQKLGPLNNDILKFDPERVKFEDENITLFSARNGKASPDIKDVSDKIPKLRDGETNIFWLKQIQQYNMTQQMSTNFYTE